MGINKNLPDIKPAVLTASHNSTIYEPLTKLPAEYAENYPVSSSCNSLQLKMELSDYFFTYSAGARVGRNSKWYSMEELITHFLFYSEGPNLPSGFSNAGVEAPKGHLGVSLVSNGGPKVSRARVRSSIQVMAGQLTALVQGVSLGDFVVIVSGSNIVIGEVDR